MDIPIIEEHIHHHEESSGDSHHLEELVHNERLEKALEPVVARIEAVAESVKSLADIVIKLVPEETAPAVHATKEAASDVVDVPLEVVEPEKEEKPEEQKRKRRKL